MEASTKEYLHSFNFPVPNKMKKIQHSDNIKYCILDSHSTIAFINDNKIKNSMPGTMKPINRIILFICSLFFTRPAKYSIPYTTAEDHGNGKLYFFSTCAAKNTIIPVGWVET